MTTRFRFRTLSNKIKKAVLLPVMCISMFAVTSCSTQGVTFKNADGTQEVNITFSGGSGKAYVESPVTVTTTGGRSYATLVFSSENYDYVIVDGEKILNENPGGKSTFTVPVKSLDEPFVFIADTTAMSKPHEIEYSITWNAADAPDEGSGEEEDTSGAGKFGQKPEDYVEPDIPGLKKTGQLELAHAKGFAVTKYGDIDLISIYGVGEYLLVPEGAKEPESIPDGVTVIRQPVTSTYLVSTSVMDLVRQTGALDAVTLTGLDEDGWHIDEAKERLHDGRMQYAGKYRAPDYELILSKGCDLAIENTMIFHNPEVKDKLEELGIPVIVETSSYEKDPLARLEWIKLYGLLYGKEDAADDFYESASQKIAGALNANITGRTVAFFSVSATGLINVRIPGDYITTMIEMAGDEYVPGSDAVRGRKGMATMNMQPEEFLAAAADADILIYNSTIEGEIGSVDNLIEKNAIFANFRAVKEGSVYCMKSDFFQKTTGAADFLDDLRKISEGSDKGLTFMEKL